MQTKLPWNMQKGWVYAAADSIDLFLNFVDKLDFQVEREREYNQNQQNRSNTRGWNQPNNRNIYDDRNRGIGRNESNDNGNFRQQN